MIILLEHFGVMANLDLKFSITTQPNKTPIKSHVKRMKKIMFSESDNPIEKINQSSKQ